MTAVARERLPFPVVPTSSASTTPTFRNLLCSEASLAMTLSRLRLVAIAAPILIVAVLEGMRMMTIGTTSPRNRFMLDTVVALAFIVFGFIMVRAINRAHEKLARQNEELVALHGSGLDIAELSLQAVLNKVVDRARTLGGAQYGALAVMNAQGGIKEFLTSGITAAEREKIGPPPVGHGLLGLALQAGEPLRLQDLTKDRRSLGFPPNHPPMRSLLAVPIPCRSPFVGNLYLTDKEGGNAFSASDQETLERFAVQAGIAIDNAHLNAQVASLAVAQERLRIAHEMHDGIAQVLGYVNTKAQAVNEHIRRGNTEEATIQLRELASAARNAYNDVRESIIDLRTLPESERSFGEVIEEYLARWKEQTGISTQLTIDANLTLPATEELQLVRIIQESLANVRKHSKAAKAKVDIRRRASSLTVTVEDDGLGFDSSTRPRSEFPQFGLATMRERAESIGATFAIETIPGQGTRVRIDAPMKNP